MCGRPAAPREVNEALTLWALCKAWKTLPKAGGVFDQDEGIMDQLDTIEQVMAEGRKARADDERNAALRERMLADMK